MTESHMTAHQRGNGCFVGWLALSFNVSKDAVPWSSAVGAFPLAIQAGVVKRLLEDATLGAAVATAFESSTDAALLLVESKSARKERETDERLLGRLRHLTRQLGYAQASANFANQLVTDTTSELEEVERKCAKRGLADVVR